MTNQPKQPSQFVHKHFQSILKIFESYIVPWTDFYLDLRRIGGIVLVIFILWLLKTFYNCFSLILSIVEAIQSSYIFQHLLNFNKYKNTIDKLNNMFNHIDILSAIFLFGFLTIIYLIICFIAKSIHYRQRRRLYRRD